MAASLAPGPQSGRERNYFNKQILALKLFGISLTGDEGTAYRIYTLVFVPATLFLYPILDFYEYFKHDFSGIAEIVIYQTAGVLAFCKVAVVFRNRVSLVKLLAKLGQEPFLPNPKRGSDEEEEIIRECVWITTVQTYTYWIMATATIIGTVGYSITKRIRSSDYHDWQFPYGPFTVLNVTRSPNFEITYFYQSISIAFIAGCFTSVDLLIAAVLAHTSYQFKIVQNNFQRLVEISYEEMMEDSSEFKVTPPQNPNPTSKIDGALVPWKYLKKSVTKAIEYHLAIINIASEVEEVFSDLLLVVFLGTLALICFSVYGASAVGHNPQLLARHLGEGICACLQVGTVCFWGEQVMQESQLVGRAVNESNFVGTDLRYQKMLSFVIRRSQNPTKVTTGKFAEIGLSTFAWILRTSYSAFMVLLRSKTNNI